MARTPEGLLAPDIKLTPARALILNAADAGLLVRSVGAVDFGRLYVIDRSGRQPVLAVVAKALFDMNALQTGGPFSPSTERMILTPNAVDALAAWRARPAPVPRARP